MKKWFHSLVTNHDIKIIVAAVVYYLSARLGLLLAFQGTSISPVWPPSGIALALLLLLGRRSWPGVLAGALVSNALVFWHGQHYNISEFITATTVIAVACTLEALAGRFLFLRWLPSRDHFSKTKYTFRFIIIAFLVSMITPLLGFAALYSIGALALDQISSFGFTWYVGDLTGVLIFTPLLLVWTSRFDLSFNRAKALESFVFLFFLAGLILLVGLEPISVIIERAFPFLVVPFLLWMAFSFNLQLAMTGIVVASITAVFFTINHRGPFLLDTKNDSLLLLQVFMGIISVTTLILSATVRERKAAQTTIEAFNENLEEKVKIRTAELELEIEERKKAENRIKISNRKLEKTNVELDSFVYSVSHDLRAPIASVKGLLNLIKSEKDIQTVNNYLAMIEKRIDQQDLFIQEILDLSQNARKGLSRNEVLFQELIDEVFSQLQFFNHAEDINKKIDIKQDGAFITDRRRVKVILNNLLSNAIRYSNGRDPFIEVSVVVNSKTATLNVKDNGIGISGDHIPHIFDMFYRATEQNTGSGLGLYIVRETVEKLQGEVQVTSELRKGTEFSVSIPALKGALKRRRGKAPSNTGQTEHA